MTEKRLSELDWLRVFLILGVFLHHSLMPFNGDDWHIMNNQSSKLLDDIMVYFEQFRLPILFFIAGVGSVILLQQVTNSQFLKDKVKRLFIPLMVGIFFIVPPQGYIENIEAFSSYWEAYPTLLAKFESNHLWFIEYLVVFSVLAIPMNVFLTSELGIRLVNMITRLSKFPTGLFSLAMILIVMRVFLKFYFPSDGHGIENLSSSLYYLYFFLVGMVFVQREQVWRALASNRRCSLAWLIGSTLLFYSYYFAPDLSQVLSISIRRSIWFALGGFLAWSALLTLIGYAKQYLIDTPDWLKKCNELIYPFYILHQTVIIIVGYYLIALDISLTAKAIFLMSIAFFTTSGLCLVLIYPFDFMRGLFGLKKRARPESKSSA